MTQGTRGVPAYIKAAIPIGVIVVALVVLINALASGRTAPTPGVFADATSLDDAVARARADGRVVFAVATADWCPPYQKYKRGALADERVAAWLEAYAAPVSIDATDGPTPETERLGVSAIPASFVLNGRGEIVARWTGDLPADELLAKLSAAAAEESGAGR